MNPDYCLITNEDEQIEEKQKYRRILCDYKKIKNKSTSVRRSSAQTLQSRRWRWAERRRPAERGKEFK